jgi:hypothetical protein
MLRINELKSPPLLFFTRNFKILDKVYLETITITPKEISSPVFYFQLTQNVWSVLEKLQNAIF